MTSLVELHSALQWARDSKARITVLGEGSNVVLAGDLSGLVLKPSLRGVEVLQKTQDSVLLRVAAGENWHNFVGWCLQQGYYGLENLALIPGTVGAGPIQNIGAYGVELEAYVEQVHALSTVSSEAIVLGHAECEFDYRDSIFKKGMCDQVIIYAVDLRLPLQPGVNIHYPALAHYLEKENCAAPEPLDIFNAVVAIRSARLPDPAVFPNAGSFFKNPIVDTALAAQLTACFPQMPVFPSQEGSAKLSAAWLIDQCGWKGWRHGAVGVHEHHALVLVNYASGTGAQLLELASMIQQSVVDTFGVRLYPEPRVYPAVSDGSL